MVWNEVRCKVWGVDEGEGKRVGEGRVCVGVDVGGGSGVWLGDSRVGDKVYDCAHTVYTYVYTYMYIHTYILLSFPHVYIHV